MALSPDRIKRALAALADRPWPTIWSAQTAASVADDYYGWCHRYRLQPRATEVEVAAFEQRNHVSLPADYRDFLLQIGNGGAGPAHGVFPLGTYEDEALPDYILAALRSPFDDAVAERWDADEDVDQHVMQGALIIGTEGCARWFWLIVTGPSAGQIWFDARTDGHPPKQLIDKNAEPISFRAWFDSWLLDSAAKWLR
jgi:hypothetical protein